MPSSKEYLQYVLEQCPEGTTARTMMGEYILYYRGRVFGGIYDERFLVKPVRATLALMPDAVRELPYEGAKPMLLVDKVDDRAFLSSLLEAMYEELPDTIKKK